MKIPNSWWFCPPTGARRGIPDWLGCVNGQFVAIELKKSKAKKDSTRETLQEYTCGEIKNAGGLVFFRATPENIDQIIETLIETGEKQYASYHRLHNRKQTRNSGGAASDL